MWEAPADLALLSTTKSTAVAALGGMEFDDHDEAEEVALSNYDPALGNFAGKKPTATSTFAGSVLSDPSGWSANHECLKNHVVSISGHAIDICGEFLPAGEEGSLEALRCATFRRRRRQRAIFGGRRPAAAGSGFQSPS